MKTTRKYPLFYMVALLGLLPMASPGAFAQTSTTTTSTTTTIGSTTPGSLPPQDGNGDADAGSPTGAHVSGH